MADSTMYDAFLAQQKIKEAIPMTTSKETSMPDNSAAPSKSTA